jgi:hypothetical protein
MQPIAGKTPSEMTEAGSFLQLALRFVMIAASSGRDASLVRGNLFCYSIRR